MPKSKKEKEKTALYISLVLGLSIGIWLYLRHLKRKKLKALIETTMTGISTAPQATIPAIVQNMSKLSTAELEALDKHVTAVAWSTPPDEANDPKFNAKVQSALDKLGRENVTWLAVI